MRELTSKLSCVLAGGLGVAAFAADSTPVAVDLQGYNSALIYILIGAGGITFDATNKVEFKLTHSDDDTTYTDVAVTDLQGKDAPASVTSGIIKSLVAAHAAAAVYEIGYVGDKRYLKLLADFSGTHGTATPMAALVVKGNPRHAPAA